LPPTYTETPHLRQMAMPVPHQEPRGRTSAEQAEFELWGNGASEAPEGAPAPVSGCFPEPRAKGGDLTDVLKGLASKRRSAAAAPPPMAPLEDAPTMMSKGGALVPAQKEIRLDGRVNFTPQGRPTVPEEKAAFVLGNKCAMILPPSTAQKQVWDVELKKWRFLGEEEDPVQPVVIGAEGRSSLEVTNGVMQGDTTSVEKRMVPTRFLAEKPVTVLGLAGGKGVGIECECHPHGTT